MNYLREVLAFYDLVQVKPLSTGQVALWHALMYINNKCAWTAWFSVPNQTLELFTGLSRTGVAHARNKLKQEGIIDFTSNGTRAASYRLVSVRPPYETQNVLDTQDIGQDTVETGSKQGQDTATLNKLKQNKTEKSTRKVFSPPTEEEVAAYCRERNNGIDAQTFVDFYTARGWVVGKSPMKDWRAAVRTWESRRKAETAATKGWESFE